MLAPAVAALCLTFTTPFPSDTPPTFRIKPPVVAPMRSHSERAAASRFVNGAVPPNNIVLPSVINLEALIDFMNERFPESASTEGESPYVWVFVSERGEAHVEGILKSTNDPALDSLIVETARQARFKPAVLGTVPVSLWVPVPILLRSDAPPGEKFVPYTEKPQLLNRDEIGRRLVQSYPPALREARVGGEVLLWILVNKDGTVTKSVVRRGAMHHELDRAAQYVARGMIFSPAKHHDKPVAVWIQIPIRFMTM